MSSWWLVDRWFRSVYISFGSFVVFMFQSVVSSLALRYNMGCQIVTVTRDCCVGTWFMSPEIILRDAFVA
jgi:hypothetical protein